MIYNDEWIFIHVPKTAGSSVCAALGGLTPHLATHTPLRDVEKGERFAFGFIRNPWARAVSQYRFLCQKVKRPAENFNQDEVRAMGFREWLRNHEWWMSEDPESAKLPMQRRPQMWWLRGCDFVGRVEDFPRSFDAACVGAGIGRLRLPHVNKTSGPDWRTEYDDGCVEFVSQWFAADIAKGGYTFDI